MNESDHQGTPLSCVKQRSDGSARKPSSRRLSFLTRQSAILGLALLGTSCDSPTADPPTPVPTALVLEPQQVVLESVGASVDLVYTVSDQDGAPLSTAGAWLSSSPDVATVSEGHVVAGANGTTTVSIVVGGLRDSSTVIVTQVPVSLTLDRSELTMNALGDTVRMEAALYDAGGSVVEDSTMIWAVSDSAVVSVSADGKITAVAAGTTNVIATWDTLAASAEVVVNPTPVSLSISLDTLRLVALGQRARLEATIMDANENILDPVNPAWTTSQAGVATVDTSGFVTAIGPGTASIVARWQGLSDSTMVLVVPTAVRLVVSPNQLSFVQLETDQALSGRLLDSGGSTVPGLQPSWTSADPAIVTVSSQGVVRSISYGITTVRVVYGTLSATISVTVSNPSLRLRLYPPALAFGRGGWGNRITAALTDLSGQPVEVGSTTWTATPASVISVDEEGVVFPQGDGVGTVTASVNGLSATANVHVDFSPPIPPGLSGMLNGTGDIWRGGVLESDWVRLTATEEREERPIPSPSGARIAYRRMDSERDYRPWLMNADGSGQRQLADLILFRPRMAYAWAPDESKLAVRTIDGALHIAEVDGPGLTTLIGSDSVPSIFEGWVADLRWRGDDWIIFEGWVSSSNNGGTWRIRPDGTDLGLIFQGVRGAAWDLSPDGQRIAYECNWGDICLVKIDGSGQRSLTSNSNNPEISDRRPVWSPDGTRLATRADRYTSFFTTAVLDANTGETLAVVPGAPWDRWFRHWSPDGQWINSSYRLFKVDMTSPSYKPRFTPSSWGVPPP